jgi:2-polyprenyl-3-methyl-5-hydroxy-6-metoxy-1,4-benzoquinol methylase
VPTDQELFNKIAIDYMQKDLTGYCRLARILRLNQTLKNIPQPVGSILEVGCGAGFTAEYLDGRYNHYLGIDYAGELIDAAQKRHQKKNVRFQCTDVDKFESDQKFDVILMIGVLHHIPEVQSTLRRLKSFLKPNGVLVANEPRKGNLLISGLRALRKKIDPNYSRDQVEYSEAEAARLLKQSGYRVRIFPQGIFSTPLAETRFLPSILGSPLAHLFKELDPPLESLITATPLRHLTWNMVIEARIIGG